MTTDEQSYMIDAKLVVLVLMSVDSVIMEE